MIGLLVLGALVLWLIIAIFLSKKIPQWFGVIKHKTVIGLLIFPLIVVMPIADDLIGMWQFRQLCKIEAIVILSPDWKNVKRAKRIDLNNIYYSNTIIPVTGVGGQYIDLDTNQVFLKSRSLFTKGGIVRRFSGLEGVSSCHPDNIRSIDKNINLSELLRKGEAK